MDKKEAYKRIFRCDIPEQMKDALCLVVSEFELFLKLKKRHREAGLLKACYRVLGVKFFGMYGIDTLEDVVRKAEAGNLLG